jgi:predicted acylesterase/phospholipase RssA
MPRRKAGTRDGPVSSPIPIPPVDDQTKPNVLAAFDTNSKAGTIPEKLKNISGHGFWTV